MQPRDKGWKEREGKKKKKGTGNNGEERKRERKRERENFKSLDPMKPEARSTPGLFKYRAQ